MLLLGYVSNLSENKLLLLDIVKFNIVIHITIRLNLHHFIYCFHERTCNAECKQNPENVQPMSLS